MLSITRGFQSPKGAEMGRQECRIEVFYECSLHVLQKGK